MNAETGKKTCFVVMPFGERPGPDGKPFNFDEVYTDIIESSAGDLKLECVRADKVLLPGWVQRDMLTRILRSDVVVVDITSANPNVYYELGIRHALRPSVTVLLKRKDVIIPFNIAGLRVIQYDMSFRGVNEAKSELKAYIQNGLDSKANDSLVYDVFPDLQVSFKGSRP